MKTIGNWFSLYPPAYAFFMTCSVCVYILITSLSDNLTAPLPWIYYTSVQDFTILKKRLPLHHANHQRIEIVAHCTFAVEDIFWQTFAAHSGTPALLQAATSVSLLQALTTHSHRIHGACSDCTVVCPCLTL